ncbi:MAG: bifunctional diaminohydroxyphosphoribosylaminopyrimidine deaminase/5-amino-6-(5-phosphoribosylamino)uracil reductase RibD [Deltaproteobacteria bacterium]|jgi:diaminohydroxyphosphoribosylaminopyrimidine deaminase/5-amino-6-(5-phosphoribosylamino)uracil reductase|nr:bifunctional diaminohydroxyphosphoribosylaminopyrimidine deaminase/5-amino-6-(5-phosphoribosylamino)uracil reductase RibD [Deltaproteobacteria bacterium]
MTSAAADERMLREALRLAARGEGRTHPNPSVGAVVYRGDRVLGRGTTRPPGGPHAEVVAIAAARRRHGERAVRGASIAVTLEPCSFEGRTGACTEAIVGAGLARVVAGCRDPHAKVSGRGFRFLRRKGLEIVSGLLESECRERHRGFISVCERGRPWVTLKLATSLDGRIALASGESRWITSPEAREATHRLRAHQDAILVGSETALADDPELTARRGGSLVHRPIRLLLDGRLRVPPTGRLFEPEGDTRTWVLCRERARGIRRVAAHAERVLALPSSGGGRVDLVAAFARLADEGLTTVLVEGGGRLAAALLRAELVDEVHWLLAPKLIGGDGRAGLGPLGLESLAQAVELDTVRVHRRGPDLHVHGRIRHGADGSPRRAGGSRSSR